MRTTVRLPDPLLARAKTFARTQNVTLTDLIRESVEASIEGRVQAKRRTPPPLPIFGGGGVCYIAGMTNAEVLDFLDEDVPPEKLR